MDRLTFETEVTFQSAFQKENRKLRLGIFGGTFDPLHIGHLILAEEALVQLQLDEIHWVLTPNPPHKGHQTISPTSIRLALLQAGIQENPFFYLSRIDLDRQPPYYAVDTLRLYQRAFPEASIFFLVGGDSLRDLPKWHAPQELLELCSALGVMRRPGDQVDLPALETKLPGISTRIIRINTPLLEISSTAIREKIKNGEAFQYYLHPEVYRLILNNHYYRGDS